ncbi:MAG: hypothetical protein JNJ76_01795, partial [Candidatus Competibacter sp.]|nr:hypothetical protein [Candidatus Competibacter sp.]
MIQFGRARHDGPSGNQAIFLSAILPQPHVSLNIYRKTYTCKRRSPPVRRSRVGLADIADWHNLAAAFRRAARGKSERDEVRLFRAGLNGELARLREALLDGSVEVGRMRSFRIRDPKPRIIHAPCFRERVLHHAVMAHVGPALDRALVDDTYACRVGKGAL